MIDVGQTPCITVTCDDCGDDCWEDGTPHFESLDQAHKYVGEDWLFTDTEQACGPCRVRRVCVAEGHVWGEWQQSKRDHLTTFRLCDRCTAFDYTVTAGEAS
jgi:hypothetical protein